MRYPVRHAFITPLLIPPCPACPACPACPELVEGSLSRGACRGELVEGPLRTAYPSTTLLSSHPAPHSGSTARAACLR
jgi:hypothetical protein